MAIMVFVDSQFSFAAVYPSGLNIGPQGHHMALSMNGILKEGNSRQCNACTSLEESSALNSPASLLVNESS